MVGGDGTGIGKEVPEPGRAPVPVAGQPAEQGPGPDLAEHRGLLVHMHIETVAQQRQRCGKTADPTPHDANPGSHPVLL
jgi:hypothetical protein